MTLGYGNGYGFSYGLADPVNLLIPYENLLPIPDLSNETAPLPRDRGLYEGGDVGGGAFTGAQPVAANAQAKAGAVQFSFIDDFYNRIHIAPLAIDFGLIAAEVSVPMEVWNAHFITATLDSVDMSTLEEDEVYMGTGSLPIDLKPLAIRNFNVQAGLNGPTRISGFIVMEFTPTETLTVTVEGQRGKLWPIVPNWSSPMRESWAYLTEIISSRTGREQRIAQRAVPRKTVEFSSLVHGDDRRTLNRLLDTAQQIEFVLPDFPRYVTATEEIEEGSLFASFDSAPEWLSAGILVVLVHGDRMELRYVEDVDTDDLFLTFKDTTTVAWPAGTRLHFGLLGNLAMNLGTRRLTNDAAEVSFRFESAPGKELEIAPPVATETWNDREVVLVRPNWLESVSLGFERNSEVVDYGRGVTRRFTPERTGSRLQRATYLGRDYATVKGTLDIFKRAIGQQREFYMPTWENDLPLRVQANAGTATLRTPGQDVARDYEDHPVMKNVMVLMRNGDRLYRRVNSISIVDDELGQDSVLLMSTTWPYNIDPAQVVMVSWMPCCRFASDSITIEWLTLSKAQMQLPIRTIEDLTAE